MKRLCFYVIWAFSTMLVGCSDFLDTENLTNKDSGNFPKTEEDIQQALTAAYAANMSDKSSRWQIFELIVEVMADYSMSGGGLDDRHVRAMAEYKMNAVNMYSGIWKRYYRGIYRTNFILENLNRVNWENEASRNSISGQAYFLRAQFHFDLVRLFENIPLVTSTVPENKPQAAPKETFVQILSDLKQAIVLLPGQKIQDMSKKDLGRVTRWAAQAMMARAYLFYSGVYGEESVVLADGSTLTRQDVMKYVDECIAQSGHDLIPDFRNLWPYAYSKEYAYTADNGLEWIGEDGKNIETVYAYKFSTMGSAQNISYCNNIDLFYGLRGQETLPFAKGWGWAPAVPRFFMEWPDDDLRKRATIWDVNDQTTEKVKYAWNKNRCYNETGYFNKKYIPVNVRNEQGKLVNYSCVLYGVTPHFQYNNTQDMVIIRFSDVLLMGAELGSAKAQEYMDRVRGRVGLASVPATLENIKRERLYELAYEGVRYYDLMRWGDLEQSVNTMQKDVPVKNIGESQIVTKVFRSETRGFLPIPEDEIALSNGVLKQNQGWDTEDALFLD